MTTVVVKLDDETLHDLDDLARDSSRSDVLRKAVRQYVARAKLEKRRREVREFMRNEAARREMSRMAEADMDEAARLLKRAEDEHAR